MFTETDKYFMHRALELAEKGAGRTGPNPMVGALIVKGGRIIGEGYHRVCGGPHAEVNAFNSCTENPEGSDMYVTLEPCAHEGRTPPCAKLIAEKKVRRVLIASQDPNPLVCGKGMAYLRSSGIEVQAGLYDRENKRLNEVFMKYIPEKEPFVLFKAAMSLDGKIATAAGESKWISGEVSRRQVHALRSRYASVMVGAGTVIADNPHLTARITGAKNPIRVIADGHLRCPQTSHVFDGSSRTIVLALPGNKQKKAALRQKGVEIIETDAFEGNINLKEAMRSLGKIGIDSILLEGGPTFVQAALKQDIIDKVRFYIAPCIIGGAGAPGPVGGPGIERLMMKQKIYELAVKACGEDFVAEGYIHPPAE